MSLKRGLVDKRVDGFFIGQGFKTITTQSGFLKADGTVDNTNYLQTLSFVNGDLSISGGNSVDLDARYIQSGDINIYTGTSPGLVPTGQNGTAKFLREDGSWSTPPLQEAGQTTLHEQTTAALVWNVNHNLGYLYPNVTVYNQANEIMIPERISAQDTNNLQLEFEVAVAGYVSVSVAGTSTHPTGDGSQHVPANGTTNNGKYLKATATAGVYVWDNPPNTNYYLSSASFNTTNGVLTLNRSGLSAVTVDLDGRYLTSAPAAQTLSWNATSNQLTISAGNTVTISGFEEAFSKNTGFNKNFGTASGTVAQGNDSRINNGQTAFGWGDHASEGYLTSFTETDPTVPSHVKSITTTEKSNWNTAFGWGNHASVGYLTSVAWGDVTGKPSTFTPSAHTHLWADITDKPSTFTPSTNSVGITELKPELKDVVDILAGATIDWSTGIQFNRVHNANLTFTFLNPVIGKTITLNLLEAGGGFTFSLPGDVYGNLDNFDDAMDNVIFITCIATGTYIATLTPYG